MRKFPMVLNYQFAIINFSKIVLLLLLTISNQMAQAEDKSSANNCEMHINGQGIVHLKAAKSEDVPFCIGYGHGRFRSLQMDHFRRLAQGRTAEIHGFSNLKTDLSMRLINFPFWANKLWDSMSESGKSYLNSYAKGASLGIAEANRLKVGELQEGYPQIDSWQGVDSIYVLLLQSFDQTRKTFSTEVENSKASAIWGEERARQLYRSDISPWNTTILKKDEIGFIKIGSHEIKSPHFENLKIAKELPENIRSWHWPTVFGEESGSNNWVISPNNSQEKVAWMANDPHLDLKTPIFWMWLSVQSPDSNAIGATLPGSPTIVNGTNLQVSWGLTNSYFNTADGIAVDEREQLESEWPVVWVNWLNLKIPFFFKKFQRTKDGFPILPLELKNEKRKIALLWTGFKLTGADFESMFQIHRSKSVKEIDESLAKVGLPSWNFVYADTSGNIGYRTIGRLTHNTKDQFGFRVQTEALTESLPTLPMDQNPHLMNPKRGWIATANNRHFPQESSLRGGLSYTQGFRAYRIEDQLVAQKKQTLESIQRLQCDVFATDAKFFLPHILRDLDANEFTELKEAFLNWNFEVDENCKVCGVYRLAMMKMMEDLQVAETGLFQLAQNQDPRWKEILKPAFREAFQAIGLKRWGDIHKNSFSHITQKQKWTYAPEMATPGDKHTVNPGSLNWDKEKKQFNHTSGASERLIVKMTKVPEVYLSLPGLNVDYQMWKSKNRPSYLPSFGSVYPWREWAQCRYSRIEWPLDWSKIPDGQKTQVSM